VSLAEFPSDSASSFFKIEIIEEKVAQEFISIRDVKIPTGFASLHAG
jgi:hypothetical protein